MHFLLTLINVLKFWCFLLSLAAAWKWWLVVLSCYVLTHNRCNTLHLGVFRLFFFSSFLLSYQKYFVIYCNYSCLAFFVKWIIFSPPSPHTHFFVESDGLFWFFKFWDSCLGDAKNVNVVALSNSICSFPREKSMHCFELVSVPHVFFCFLVFWFIYTFFSYPLKITFSFLFAVELYTHCIHWYVWHCLCDSGSFVESGGRREAPSFSLLPAPSVSLVLQLGCDTSSPLPIGGVTSTQRAQCTITIHKL